MKIRNILTNNFYCKLFFILVPFLNEIPFLMAYANPLMKFGILLCAIYLLSDLLTDRQLFRMDFITPIALFLFAGLISCVLNIRSEQARMNIISYLYNFCTLLVLFPVSKKKSEEQQYREFEVINVLLLVMISVCSAIALYMFFSKTQVVLKYNDYTYRMGFHDGRLVGLLRNAIYPTHAIGIFCGFIQLEMNNVRGRRCKIAPALILLTIVINFFALVLQQSKGLNIGMICATFFVVVAMVYQHKYRANPLHSMGAFGRTAIAVPSATVAAGLYYGLDNGVIRLSKKVLAMITIANTSSKPNANNPSADQIVQNGGNSVPNTPTNPNTSKPSVDQIVQDAEDFIGRSEVSEKYGAMTGRPYVWKSGLRWWQEKPLFGYGSHTLANEVKPYAESTEQLTHFHNIFIQTLVSYGVVGLISLLTLVVSCVTRVLKAVFTLDNNKNLRLLIMACGLIVFMFVINMADTTILFMMKHSGFVFFIYLGYVLHWCNGKESFLDKPFRVVADWLDSKVCHEK